MKLLEALKKKESKVLFENFISLSLLQTVGSLLHLITLPYLLRVLGFSKYGMVILAFSLVAYFQSLTDYSFKVTATRDVSIFRNNIKKLSLIYSKVIIVKSIFFLISMLLISIVVLSVPTFRSEWHIIYLATLSLLGNVLLPEWFFQGIEKMKFITLINVGIKLFFTISVFFLIKKESDYWVYPLLNGLGVVIGGIVSQIILIRSFKLKLYVLKFRIIKNTISSNFNIFVNQFLPLLYNNTSSFLLGTLLHPATLGVYDALRKIVDIITMLVSIISRVFFPFLNRRKDKFLIYRNLIISVSIALVAGVLSIHSVIFEYLNMSYDSAFLVLFILSVGVFGYVLYDVYGLNYFIIRRQDKLVRNNTLMASLIGLSLSFPLISCLGIVGAAINLSFARLLMGGVLFFKWRRYFKHLPHY
ncbi:oligosaccharide flippase family protein [Schleiferiaceae bacterium]|nr:oligosaccharide flippase family protein [Schleiferiaceae bacterium]